MSSTDASKLVMVARRLEELGRGREVETQTEDDDIDLSMAVAEVTQEEECQDDLNSVAYLEDEFWSEKEETSTSENDSAGAASEEVPWYNRHGVSCDICGSVYSSKANCERHIEREHGVTMEVYRVRYGRLLPRQKFRWGNMYCTFSVIFLPF